MAGTHPEAELLLCCARTQLDPTRAQRLRTLLQYDLDWVYLLRTAICTGMLPLLYWHLNTTCPEAIPPGTLAQLRYQFEANAQRNRFLTEELLQLLQLLAAHGIAALPFKGPVLAASVYGNLALRQFSDLDILVHKRDILPARDLLLSRGYTLPLTRAEQRDFLRDRYHFHFVRVDSLVHVELHWAFTRKYWSVPLDYERLWERLESVPLAGRTVLNLRPEDLLLILCVHGFKDRWQRLDWICDVAELIHGHPGLEWREVLAHAGKVGSRRIVFLGLHLARDLLGTALPEAVGQRMQADPVVNSLAADIRERLFAETSGPLQGVASHVFFFSRMRERWRDRVPYLLYHLPGYLLTPNEKDRAFLPLPTSLSFLYYLIRPIRLVSVHGPMPLFKALLGS